MEKLEMTLEYYKETEVRDMPTTKQLQINC